MRTPFKLPVKTLQFIPADGDIVTKDEEFVISYSDAEQEYIDYIIHCVNNYEDTLTALQGLLSILHQYDDGTYYLEESEDTEPILYFARRIAEQTI